MKTKNEFIEELLKFIKETSLIEMDYSSYREDDFVEGYNEAVDDANIYTKNNLDEFEKEFLFLRDKT